MIGADDMDDDVIALVRAALSGGSAPGPLTEPPETEWPESDD
jgi:hypothetical protein